MNDRELLAKAVCSSVFGALVWAMNSRFLFALRSNKRAKQISR